MVYKFVSSREVIRRFIRNTRISDSSYFQDMDEWIVEAARKMYTQYTTIPVTCELKVKDYRARLPKDILFGKCFIYQGSRMNEAGDAMPGMNELNPSFAYSYEKQTTVTIDVDKTTTEEINFFLKGYQQLPCSDKHFYKLKGNYVQVSIKEGCIDFVYAKAPRDADGFWEIPDNEDFKEACYWYIRARLIGLGWEDPNPKNTEDSCLQKFEGYAARAIGQITYPSPDRMQRILERQQLLIGPQNYWASSFSDPHQI